jgi:hypothetical protein
VAVLAADHSVAIHLAAVLVGAVTEVAASVAAPMAAVIAKQTIAPQGFTKARGTLQC